MAQISNNKKPTNYDVYSNEKPWETIPHIKGQAKLIKQLNNYRLYLAPAVDSEKTFYLTDVNDKYLASIDFVTKKKIENHPAVTIEYGYAKERGTYKILLDSILKYSEYKYILSDNNLSDRAGKFYKKLVQDGTYKVQLYKWDDNIVVPFDEDNAYNNRVYRIMIGLKSK